MHARSVLEAVVRWNLSLKSYHKYTNTSNQSFWTFLQYNFYFPYLSHSIKCSACTKKIPCLQGRQWWRKWFDVICIIKKWKTVMHFLCRTCEWTVWCTAPTLTAGKAYSCTLHKVRKFPLPPLFPNVHLRAFLRAWESVPGSADLQEIFFSSFLLNLTFI